MAPDRHARRARLPANAQSNLSWNKITELPATLGVAGPFVGTHKGAIIVAGGANFPTPVWDKEKVWHDQIHVLLPDESGWTWVSGGNLPRPIAYGASVSTPSGVLCMGGNDASNVFFRHFPAQMGRSESTSHRQIALASPITLRLRFSHTDRKHRIPCRWPTGSRSSIHHVQFLVTRYFSMEFKQ